MHPQLLGNCLGKKADHDRLRKRPRLRCDVANVVDHEPYLFLDLTYDRIFQALTRLEEPRQRRIHRRWPYLLTSHHATLVRAVMHQHDHRRVGAWEAVVVAGGTVPLVAGGSDHCFVAAASAKPMVDVPRRNARGEGQEVGVVLMKKCSCIAQRHEHRIFMQDLFDHGTRHARHVEREVRHTADVPEKHQRLLDAERSGGVHIEWRRSLADGCYLSGVHNVDERSFVTQRRLQPGLVFALVAETVEVSGRKHCGARACHDLDCDTHYSVEPKLPIYQTVNGSALRRLPRLPILGAACASTTALVLLAIAGTRARYVADDYYFARGVRERGFWGVQLHFYRTWSGRVSSSLVQATLKYLGPWTAPLFPAVILGLWVLGSLVLVRMFDRRKVLTLTAVVALATSYVAINIFSAPNLFQTLFWESGSPNYAVPQMVVPWIAAAMFGRRWPILGQVVAGVLTLFLAATSEPAVVVSVSVLIAFAVLHKGKRVHYVGPLLGAVVGAAVVALAPGNAVRQTAIFQTRTPLDNIVLALVEWLLALQTMVISHPWSACGAAAFGLTCAKTVSDHGLTMSRQLLQRVFLATTVLLTALPLAVFTVFAILTGTHIPARAVPVVLNPMLLGIGLLFFAIGIRLLQQPVGEQPQRPRQRVGPHLFRISTVSLGAMIALGSTARLPGEFAGGASLVRTTQSIDRQFESKTTSSIAMPLLVGGVYFASPEDLRDPQGYWGKRFASSGIHYVVTDTELWSSPHCRLC